MITGAFANGRPVLNAQLWCPALQFRKSVDLSIGQTRISLADMRLNPIAVLPMDDAEPVRMPGHVTLGFSRRCILGFEDHAGLRVTANVDALLFDGDADESRLGRDVLDEWLMVFDGPARTIVFDSLAT